MTLALGFRASLIALAAMVSSAGLVRAQGLTGELAPGASSAFVQGPADAAAATSVLAAARSGDGARVRAILDQTTDPLTRKIALWALADASPEFLTWDQADAARRDLAEWPRPARRQAAAEKLIERSPLDPSAIIAWFDKEAPTTPQGAMALTEARRRTGQTELAAEVIRRAWRTMTFDSLDQEVILGRFGALLTPADHVAREDFLLYGIQGPAAQDMLKLLPPSEQAIALARMAVRRGDTVAQAMIEALPPADQTRPGLVYERVMALRDRGDLLGALSLIPYLPAALPDEHAAARLWKRGILMVQALQAGDATTAYQVAARSGLTTGPDAASAEFYAGWIALARMKNAPLADEHFAKLQHAGPSPLTQSRALYWRGRAAEAEGDLVAAQLFYQEAATYYTTFYGQLAGAKTGKTQLVLGHDPTVTADDLARFEARDSVRAARLFARAGNTEALRAFVLGLSETLPTAAEAAMLVDLARGYGDQELSMRVVRNVAKRGFILPERGYPLRAAPSSPMAAEPPLVLSITRQESSFDPNARSGVGARGMMQLMPATAQQVARRSGLGWGSLEDPDFNMKVGSVYLGQLVDQFSGSYVMAAAAYNAGPSRPTQWAAICGDPRASSTDPLDFIECIPFSETRDYVMRVMESTEVYRARLNGGAAPLTLAADLKRGGYVYHPSSGVAGR
jgi:soluble lytic murein transglycosylase